MDMSKGTQAPGPASELVAKINDGMMQLQDMMAQANLPEAQEMAQLVSGFQGLVEKLGQSADQPQEEPQSAAPGQMPAEMGSNPNAKQM